MKTHDREYEDVATGRRDAANTTIGPVVADEIGIPPATHLGRSGRPISEASAAMKRLLSFCGGTALMGIGIVAATLVLTYIGSHATHPGRKLEADELPDGGIIVRSELLHIWVPETLTELAEQQSRAPAIRDHEGLKRFLELRDQRDVWYALTVRAHQVNGGFADITVIRRPYHDPEYFPELLAVLATTAGNPPRDSDMDFSTASIHIIPEELARREPRGAIVELLDDPPPPVAHGRGHDACPSRGEDVSGRGAPERTTTVPGSGLRPPAETRNSRRGRQVRSDLEEFEKKNSCAIRGSKRMERVVAVGESRGGSPPRRSPPASGVDRGRTVHATWSPRGRGGDIIGDGDANKSDVQAVKRRLGTRLPKVHPSGSAQPAFRTRARPLFSRNPEGVEPRSPSVGRPCWQGEGSARKPVPSAQRRG